MKSNNRSKLGSDNKGKNSSYGDFPGGVVVKNPPTNAGDRCLIPGLGRS